MLTVEESIQIDKPRPEVFEFFSDPDKVAVYSSNLVDYEVISGDAREVGRKARFAVKVVGVRLDYTDELVEFVENERIKLASSDGKIPYSITMDLQRRGIGHQGLVVAGVGVPGRCLQARRRAGAEDVRPRRALQPGERQDPARSLSVPSPQRLQVRLGLAGLQRGGVAREQPHHRGQHGDLQRPAHEQLGHPERGDGGVRRPPAVATGQVDGALDRDAHDARQREQPGQPAAQAYDVAVLRARRSRRRPRCPR